MAFWKSEICERLWCLFMIRCSRGACRFYKTDSLWMMTRYLMFFIYFFLSLIQK